MGGKPWKLWCRWLLQGWPLCERKVRGETFRNYLFFYTADLQLCIRGNERLCKVDLRLTREERRPVISAGTDFQEICLSLTGKVKSLVKRQQKMAWKPDPGFPQILLRKWKERAFPSHLLLSDLVSKFAVLSNIQWTCFTYGLVGLPQPAGCGPLVGETLLSWPESQRRKQNERKVAEGISWGYPTSQK